MGYFVSWAFDDREEIVDGDQVASNSGWAAFAGWAAGLDGGYPELGYLGEHGDSRPAGAIRQLEADLARAIKEKPGGPPAPVLGVAKSLLAAVKARPEGADALAVTDGTEGGGG